ncbi:DJ-1/PfpI family protein [Aquabacterium sp.]|uniref:DJ-1/PfpI family protein n=1 Tax=Aquabacterium sp. TaxID=1872578 RepID=UPI002B59DE9C|nr:DJ-1/PfpI family protein [Aquabacterium sp.]HSW04229.1 DJ-1/PfpI family protein [Aquabacterium sp.]
MHIAILTFDGFNELDSLIAYGMLSRIARLGDTDWRVSIASPTPRVTSMNGLTLEAQIDLAAANEADAVVIGSGMKTREVAADAAIMGQLQLDPDRQLIAAQCSGTFLLAKLGLLGQVPACTDSTSKPWVQAAGVQILNQAFVAQGNVATAGGCLSAQYISAWLISRLKGLDAAREVLHYFAPVGEKEVYVERALAHVVPGHVAARGDKASGPTRTTASASESAR